MAVKKIVIDAPKHPVVRYAIRGERVVELDLRGIRNKQKGFRDGGLGQKKRWVTPQHLECIVKEYFESCNGPLIDRHGQLVYDKNGDLVKTQIRPYTISGLALYLGVTTESLKKYTRYHIDYIFDEMRADVKDEDRLTCASVILNAKHRIETYAESRLYDRDGSNGARYVLDNAFKWTTQKEQAEIEKMKDEMKLKREEFEHKKQMLEDGADDTGFTINIVRAGEE